MHKDHYGWLPLHHAAFEGRAEACRLLASRNRHALAHADHDGRHPLALAAEEGHCHCVAALLRLAAPVNRANLECKTPLRLAAQAGHSDVCRTLVANGAAIEAKDIDGHTALYALVSHSVYDLTSPLRTKLLS